MFFFFYITSMRYLFFLFFLSVVAFAKPQVVWTGVASVKGGDRPLGDPRHYEKMFFKAIQGMQNELPFDLVTETDAEATKHDAGDPISMVILLTRDDLQVEHFNKIGVTKTVANLGFSVLFYQTRKVEDGSVRNTILASIPLNSYMTNEKELTRVNVDAERPVMMDKIARELISKRFKERVGKIRIDEFSVDVACDESGCFVENSRRNGLEVGQCVSLKRKNGESVEDAFVKNKRGYLELADGVYDVLRAEGGAKGTTTNLMGYSENTWQVTKVNITSKKAASLFQKEPIASQLAQWYSDYLSGYGKSVLPPVSGAEWTTNSMGRIEMVLAMEDGELLNFEMAPAKNNVVLGFSGVASGAIQKNKVEELWAYKVWLTRKVNSRPEIEEEFTTSKKITVATQEVHEVDVFRDLLHVSTKKFAEKGE